MKPWFKSKTIWLNLIVATLAAVQSMAPTMLPPVAGPWILFAASILNVWLRVISASEITQ